MGNNNQNGKAKRSTKIGMQKTIEGFLGRLDKDLQSILESLNPNRQPLLQPIPVPQPVYRRVRR